MDPASAAVAFVGFTASLTTLVGLVADTSRTLYELQDKARNAPDELRRLRSTLVSLESMLLEIQRRSVDLNDLSVSAEIKHSWKATVGLLESAIVTLQGWLTQSFGSVDLEKLGRKQLMQRMKLFVAEKKLEAFRRSINEYVNQLGLLQGLLISSQCRSLSAQYQVVPDMVSRISDEISLGTSTTVQTVQGLRSDIVELCQTQLTAIESLRYLLGYHRQCPKSAPIRHNRGRLLAGVTKSSNSSRLLSQNSTRSTVRSENQTLGLICALPIGVLYYRRGHQQSTLTDTESGVAQTIDEKSKILFKFIPARWISDTFLDLTIERCQWRDQTRSLTIRLKGPARVCFDEEVIKSLGLRPDDKYSCHRRNGHSMDLEAFRKCLMQGRVGPNDVLYSHKMQGFVTILEAVIANMRWQPNMAYQICEVLLKSGARIDNKSSDHGTPLYIASGGGLRIVNYPADNGIITNVYHRYNLLSSEIENVKSIQRLLLHYGATFDLHLPYRGLTAWSEDHGWITRLMSISNDPEYLRQVLFYNIDVSEINDFNQCDRWLIAILCHTFPALRAILEAQVLSAHGIDFQSFPSELSLPTVLEQVKAAPPEDRCLLIGSICRYGTPAMLHPFLQGDFDLGERPRYCWETHQFDESYFCQAAQKTNIDVMKALCIAGARLRCVDDFVKIFDGRPESRLCAKRDTNSFIEFAFAGFDFEDCEQRHEILGHLFRNPYQFLANFEDPLLAFDYILTGLIQRRCFFARPPMSLDQLFVHELFEAIRWHEPYKGYVKDAILHIINHYKPNLEFAAVTESSFEKGLCFKVTALGLAIDQDKLELVQMLLDAGANIEAPIAGGRSALELATENMLKPPRKSWKNGRHARAQEAFRILIVALKIRGLHSIADQAILHVCGCPGKAGKGLPNQILQNRGTAKKFRIVVGYLLGQKPRSGEEYFHWAVAKWMRNARNITALNVDGIFIRIGFLFSVGFVITFEVWKILKELISGKRPSIFVLRLVAGALIGVVFALKFQYAEARANTVM